MYKDIYNEVQCKTLKIMNNKRAQIVTKCTNQKSMLSMMFYRESHHWSFVLRRKTFGDEIPKPELDANLAEIIYCFRA